MSTTLPKYKNADVPIEERVESLLQEMTLDEKLAQVGCIWSTSLVRDSQFDPDYAASLMPHGIGQVTRIGASTGLRPAESADLMNAIQRVAIERTRLGIPIFVHEESVGGLMQRDATVFPQGLGLAATWDPDLLEKVAGVIREQMLAVGARLGLAPVLDIARDPRWGRVEETYGEDPILSGTMGTAYVRGLQTSDLSRGVAATGKHFLGYAMSDGGRNWNPVQLGPRELREVYAEPFAAVIRDAAIQGMMNSYASIDGVPCAGSHAILTGLLRDELGFQGAVVADYFSVSQLDSFHRVAASKGEAAAAALLAGLDAELPATDYYAAPLKAEIESGRVPEEVLDLSVRRILALKFKLGLFESPYVNASAAGDHFQTPEQRDLARVSAAESIILLKNNGVLPLSHILKKIAVVGPGADDPRLLQGDYHYPAHQEIIYGNPERSAPLANIGSGDLLPRAGGAFAPGPYYTPHVTPLAGLRAALDENVEISYARGCDVMNNDRSGFPEAVAAAHDSDVVIAVVAGRSGIQRPATVGESNDASNLDLTGAQQDLVDALAATGKPLVVVVLSGRVHTLADVESRAAALLQLFPPGEEGGSALAAVLTGAVNPSGRLPVTMPRSVGQVPIYYAYRAGGDRPMFFNDYTDCEPTPLFPFGHGLSYTTFDYSDLEIAASTTLENIVVSLTIQNSGERAGEEVVQLYYRDNVASVARQDRQLIGFSRVALGPGESGRLTFTVHPSRLAFYDTQMRFVTEPGDFTFYVGASSADIRQEQTVQLTGEIAQYKQSAIKATSSHISMNTK